MWPGICSLAILHANLHILVGVHYGLKSVGKDTVVQYF